MIIAWRSSATILHSVSWIGKNGSNPFFAVDLLCIVRGELVSCRLFLQLHPWFHKSRCHLSFVQDGEQIVDGSRVCCVFATLKIITSGNSIFKKVLVEEENAILLMLRRLLPCFPLVSFPSLAYVYHQNSNSEVAILFLTHQDPGQDPGQEPDHPLTKDLISQRNLWTRWRKELWRPERIRFIQLGSQAERASPGWDYLQIPFPTQWGEASLVDAHLLGLQYACQNNPKVKRVYLVSGSCIPIQPASKILTDKNESRSLVFKFGHSQWMVLTREFALLLTDDPKSQQKLQELKDHAPTFKLNEFQVKKEIQKQKKQWAQWQKEHDAAKEETARNLAFYMMQLTKREMNRWQNLLVQQEAAVAQKPWYGQMMYSLWPSSLSLPAGLARDNYFIQEILKVHSQALLPCALTTEFRLGWDTNIFPSPVSWSSYDQAFMHQEEKRMVTMRELILEAQETTPRSFFFRKVTRDFDPKGELPWRLHNQVGDPWFFAFS